MTIGVLVTNYNSWELALECIDANIKLCGSGLNQIVLIDDHSEQTATEGIDAKVMQIHNETNIGLVKCLNRGMALMETDIVVIFDADAKPLNDYVGAIAETFDQHPELALVGFRTVDEHNSPTASSEAEPGMASLLLGQSLYAKYQKFRVNKRNRSICIYTCALAVRRKAFIEMGGFDEEFDWLDLDHDFSMRVNRSQWALCMASGPLAYHKGGGSPQITSQRVLRFYKNRWYLLRKFGKIKMPALAKSAILARLWTEYAFLLVLSRFLYRNETTRIDKLQGRRIIIQFCAENY